MGTERQEVARQLRKIKKVTKQLSRLKEICTMLLTAVLVVVLMNILQAIIQPWLPLLLAGVVVMTVGWMLFARATRL